MVICFFSTRLRIIRRFDRRNYNSSEKLPLPLTIFSIVDFSRFMIIISYFLFSLAVANCNVGDYCLELELRKMNVCGVELWIRNDLGEMVLKYFQLWGFERLFWDPWVQETASKWVSSNGLDQVYFKFTHFEDVGVMRYKGLLQKVQKFRNWVSEGEDHFLNFHLSIEMGETNDFIGGLIEYNEGRNE